MPPLDTASLRVISEVLVACEKEKPSTTGSSQTPQPVRAVAPLPPAASTPPIVIVGVEV